jgi:hypothetical protein
MTERARPKRPPAGPVLWGSIVLFAALLFLLAFRFSAEPAKGGATAQPTQVRKVIKRRVVTTVVPSPGQNSVSSGPVSSSSYSAPGAEPVVTSSS